MREAPEIERSEEEAAPESGDLPIAPRVGLTEEAKTERRRYLGSSDIGAVVEVNPWSTPHLVWLDKVMNVEKEENEATTLGHMCEPTIGAIYADRYGCKITRGRFIVGPEPWMACTTDFHIEGGGIMEAKLVGLRSMWMWGQGNTETQESDQVPMQYLCQAQWQLICTGEPFVDIGALMGTEFRSYRILPNAAVQRGLIEKGRRFWFDYVVPRIPPPADGSEGCREMLKRLYPRHGGDPIRASDQLEELAAKLEAARVAFDAAETEKRLRENEIKAVLKETGGVRGNGWSIRFRTQVDGKRPFYFTPDKDKAKGRAA